MTPDAQLAELARERLGHLTNFYGDSEALRDLQQADELGLVTPDVVLDALDAYESPRPGEGDPRPWWEDGGYDALRARLAEFSANGSGPVAEPELQSWADVRAEPLRWLWRNRAAVGKLTIVEGPPDVGKSLLALSIAASLTTGAPLLGESESRGGPRHVLVVTGLEDDVADTALPRFVAAGGDRSRIHSVPGLSVSVDDLRRHVDRLDPALIVVDRLMALLPERASERSTKDVQAGLAPIVEWLGAETNAAMIGGRHYIKGGRGVAAIDRGQGSASLGGVGRFVLGLVRDPDHPPEAGRRVLGFAKANVVADSERTSLKVGLVPVEVEVDGIHSVQPVLRSLGLDPRGLDDVLRESDAAERAESDDTTAWLLERLADGEEHASADVKADAEADGVSLRKLDRRLERLKQAGKVLVTPTTTFPRTTNWQLAPQSHHANHTGGTGATGATGTTEEGLQ